MSLSQQIAAALQHDAARPLITYYDDETGERVELSVATAANWIAKTANLLRDSLDLQPGGRVAVALPTHWQTVVVHLATWLAGGCVVACEPGSLLPSGCPVAFVAERDLPALQPISRGVETVALSLRPMAGRLATPTPGVLDYAVEVPGHGDHFAPGPAGPGDGPAALVDGVALTAEEILARCVEFELTAGERVLVRHQPWTADGLTSSLAPLLAGTGALLCVAVAAHRLDSRLTAERVVRTLG